MLDKLKDWKQFERLCADLLAAEGFLIDSEATVDTTGTDFLATEEYRSHIGQVIRIRWRVQCKHYAGSGTNLRRNEAVEILHLFDLTAAADEGLFIIVSTDYAEGAKRVFDEYVKGRQTRRITIWNQRQLISKLERHPDILRRYGLGTTDADFMSILATLDLRDSLGVLLISDQSALAHDVARAFRQLGSRLTFLPFWMYTDSARLELMRRAVLKEHIDLVICFLGDSFGLPLPKILIDIIINSNMRASSILLFPFLAWTLRSGRNPAFADIIPVELLDPVVANKEFSPATRVLGEYRKGDFRWLLAFESFAESQYMELSPADNDNIFSAGISDKFGILHSFEYLRPLPGARVRFKDTSGNPLVVTRETNNRKVCYLNTCCHSCLSNVPVLSPLSTSSDFAILFRNILTWLVAENAAEAR